MCPHWFFQATNSVSVPQSPSSKARHAALALAFSSGVSFFSCKRCCCRSPLHRGESSMSESISARADFLRRGGISAFDASTDPSTATRPEAVAALDRSSTLSGMRFASDYQNPAIADGAKCESSQRNQLNPRTRPKAACGHSQPPLEVDPGGSN